MNRRLWHIMAGLVLLGELCSRAVVQLENGWGNDGLPSLHADVGGSTGQARGFALHTLVQRWSTDSADSGIT